MLYTGKDGDHNGAGWVGISDDVLRSEIVICVHNFVPYQAGLTMVRTGVLVLTVMV